MIERSYSLVILGILLLGYFLTKKIDYLVLIAIFFLDSFFNNFLKEYIFKPIMKNKKFPIIGIGTRPNKNKICSDIIDPNNKILSTYGMPSGHAQNAVLFCVILILIIINEKYENKKSMISIILIVTFLFIYERLHNECHTYQQIIVGGIIGLFISFPIYYNLRTIRYYLKLI